MGGNASNSRLRSVEAGYVRLAVGSVVMALRRVEKVCLRAIRYARVVGLRGVDNVRAGVAAEYWEGQVRSALLCARPVARGHKRQGGSFGDGRGF